MSARIALIVLLATASFLAGCLQTTPPATTSNQKAPQPPIGAAEPKGNARTTPTRPSGFVGFYILDDPTFYGTASMEATPPGQIMHLGVEPQRWMMRNMLSAFGGKWSTNKEETKLEVNEGPAGKIEGEQAFIAVRTDKGIDLVTPSVPDKPLHFTYLREDAPAGFGYDEFLGSTKKP